MSDSSSERAGKYAVLVAALVMALAVVSLTAYRASNPNATNGILSGTMDIGPVFPVCRPNATLENATYVNNAVLRNGLFPSIEVSPSWSLYAGCELVGKFSVPLRPGSYSLRLENCSYVGCNRSLPVEVTVPSGETVNVSINIDTGIR